MEKIFHRGSRCYGTSIDNTRLIFIRGIHSWTNAKMKEFIQLKCKKFKNNILSVKRITNFNDSFFRIKIYTPNFNQAKFIKIFEKAISGVNISDCKCSRRNHKVSKRKLKQKFISNNVSNESTVNSSSTTSVNSVIANQVPNISNLTSRNPTAFSNLDKFSFCLSWNTNGWNFVKRDSIEYFNTIFKPLFLCFQETGNGTNDVRYPCKVTLPNYKYFQKRMDPSIPGCRGLYLGYHVSCQAVLEDNSYTHLVSLTTYSLWNNNKCSVGNVYVPTKKHNLQVRYAFSEVFTWLQNHTNHPSILLGDFNMSTADLQGKLSDSNLGNWFILPINGSSISWNRGRFSSDIDHALVNASMLEKISCAYFVDYSSVSDHLPLLVYCKKTTTDESFLLPKKFVRWDRYKCLELKNEICDHNKFDILSEEISSNDELSTDSIVEKFISTTNSIAKDLSILTSTEIRKAMFRMSRKIYCLQNIKII